jgi:serine/threonine protein phosphatase 1
MLKRLFASRPRPQAIERVTSVPPGSRVYAIGDIHGRADLLADLHGKLKDDARQGRIERRCVVYLGDYVDRGLQSREVIDLLLDAPLEGFESVHLMGNHEEFMLRFLEEPKAGPGWFMNGGGATLYSYGVRMPARGTDLTRISHLGEQLRGNLPERHLAFLTRLKRWHIEGDYYFVHAGIRPGVPLEEQRDEDILWIREPFLDDQSDHGKMVVHGHTITPEPELRPNRIGIDTGAYATGVLTCLVLEGSERRFLQTSAQG